MVRLQCNVSTGAIVPIFQLVYRSTYRAGWVNSPLALVRDILKTSARRNAEDSITGYLIFDGLTFAQVLEGPSANVQATFARISADRRHRDVALIEERLVGERDFSGWLMGGCICNERNTAVFAKHSITDTLHLDLNGSRILNLAKDLAGLREVAR